MPPALLVFDSATERLSVAVVAHGRTWLADGPGGAAASQTLLPTAARLMAEAGLGWAQLDAIGFGRGPGAFTGLRTACSVAQGLAFAHDRPVLAIDTLLAVAEEARLGATGATDPPFDIAVLQDARMGELYGARYRHAEVGWATVEPAALWSAADWCAAHEADLPAAVAGSALDAFGPTLRTGAAQRHAASAPTARALATLVSEAWQRGEARPAEAAAPLYVRNQVALTTAERAALRPSMPPSRPGLRA
jgi:tRNA threonylcarbamoyladenosine biosynthesis protein TsaB